MRSADHRITVFLVTLVAALVLFGPSASVLRQFDDEFEDETAYSGLLKDWEIANAGGAGRILTSL